MYLPSPGEVPELHLARPLSDSGGRGQQPPIRAEGHAIDYDRMPIARGERLTRRGIPDHHGPVGAARRDSGPVGAEGDAVRVRIVPREAPNLPTARAIPEPHRAVAVGKRQMSSVGAEGEVGRLVLSPRAATEDPRQTPT